MKAKHFAFVFAVSNWTVPFIESFWIKAAICFPIALVMTATYGVIVSEGVRNSQNREAP